MWLFLVFLLSTVVVEARVTFAKSEVLDNVDLSGLNAVAPFRCSNGCRVYSPTGSDTIAIFDQAGNQKQSLGDLARNNTGIELPGGEYQLRNTGLPDPAFVFYAVEKDADNCCSPVKYQDTADPFIMQFYETGPVTILSSTGAVTFSSFANFDQGNFHSVYAVGFDSISSCRPVYKPRQSLTPLTYTLTSVSVHSPIATIDIKQLSGVLTPLVSVSGGDSQYTLGTDASGVYISPGYVGCPDIPSVGTSLYTLLPNVTEIHSSLKFSWEDDILHKYYASVAVNGYYNIANQDDGISLKVNDDIKQLYGNVAISESFNDTKFYIDFSWSKHNDNDFFAIQIEIDTMVGNDVTTSASENMFSLISYIVISLFMSL